MRGLTKDSFKHIRKRIVKFKNSLRAKIFAISFLMILVALSITLTFSLKVATTTVERNTANFSYQVVSGVLTNIEFYLDEMSKITDLCNYNYSIQKYLKNFGPDKDLERYVDRTDSTELLKNILSVREDITSVFIFGDNGYVLRVRPEQQLVNPFKPQDYLWYNRAINNFGKPVMTPTHYQDYLVNDSKRVVSMSRVITSFDNQESLGVVLIDLNLNVIKKICDQANIGKTGFVYIIDGDGNPIYKPQLSAKYNTELERVTKLVMSSDKRNMIYHFEGKRNMVTVAKSELSGWKVVSIASMDELNTGIKSMWNVTLMVVFYCAIILFVLAVWISSRVTAGISDLERSMKEAEEGNLEVVASEEGGDEIARMNRKFNRMVSKINLLMNQVVLEQEELRKTELKLLQSHINPHFLYNTLDSIIWMAEADQKEEVVEMVSSLSMLFRLSLSKGDDVISVEDEIEHVTHYLNIQRHRYKSKMDFVIEASPEVLGYMTLKMILQPIVENAIYHGLKPQREKGMIQIKAGVEKDHIVFTVEDNGVGMDENQLEQLRNGVDHRKKFNGVALKNVADRIALTYKDKSCGIFYESKLGEGTKVTLILPLLMPKEENHEN